MHSSFSHTVLILSLLIMMIDHKALAGKEGNGGDVVDCVASKDNAFEGYYNLDWIATYRRSNANADVPNVASWEASRDRILRILQEKSPALGKSFASYLEHFENTDNYAGERLWIERSFGLVPLADEKLKSKLPSNCFRADDEQRQIIQTVLRSRERGITTYRYDSKIWQDLKVNRPLQFSFISVHEWLWDLTDNPEVMRNVNRLLHTTTVATYTPEQFERAMIHFGLAQGDNNGFVPICERSQPVRELLEQLTSKSCHEITESNRRHIREMNFQSVSFGNLQAGDFSGLPGLAHINLKGFGLRTLPANLFSYLPNLAILDLSKNKLHEINVDAFKRLVTEEEISLNLSDNPIVKVDLPSHIDFRRIEFTSNHLSDFNICAGPHQLQVQELTLSFSAPITIDDQSFKACTSMTDLNIKDSEISLTTASFNKLKKLATLKLQHNQIEHIPEGWLAENTEIHTVDLGYNHIAELPGKFLDKNHRIANIFLNDNRLTNLPIHLFGSSPALTYWRIDLSGNQLSHTLNPFLAPGFGVFSLNLARNRFQFVPAWFEHLTFAGTPGDSSVGAFSYMHNARTECQQYTSGCTILRRDFSGSILLFDLSSNSLNTDTKSWMQKHFSNARPWRENKPYLKMDP